MGLLSWQLRREEGWKLSTGDRCAVGREQQRHLGIGEPGKESDQIDRPKERAETPCAARDILREGKGQDKSSGCHHIERSILQVARHGSSHIMRAASVFGNRGCHVYATGFNL